ncbi:MAG TPA: NAD-dependent epimerase/dehydratase family protein, partial [Acidobacteriota bacterium]
MKVLVSGSTGLIGSALIPSLEAEGHTIQRLVRTQPTSENEIFWDPDSKLDSSKLPGFDAVIHLAGESIMGRWNAEKKAKIRNSRVEGTESLAEALASITNPPKVFICASAIGYYGDRGNELLKEDSPPGTSFLAETC